MLFCQIRNQQFNAILNTLNSRYLFISIFNWLPLSVHASDMAMSISSENLLPMPYAFVKLVPPLNMARYSVPIRV